MRSTSVLFEVKPRTGEPDAGDLPVRFGGRGAANQCGLPTPIKKIRNPSPASLANEEGYRQEDRDEPTDWAPHVKRTGSAVNARMPSLPVYFNAALGTASASFGN